MFIFALPLANKHKLASLNLNYVLVLGAPSPMFNLLPIKSLLGAVFHLNRRPAPYLYYEIMNLLKNKHHSSGGANNYNCLIYLQLHTLKYFVINLQINKNNMLNIGRHTDKIWTNFSCHLGIIWEL